MDTKCFVFKTRYQFYPLGKSTEILGELKNNVSAQVGI